MKEKAPGRSNKLAQTTARTTGLPRLLSLNDAADVTGLSIATLRRRVSDGSLRAHRVGPKLLKVDRDSLLELIGAPIGAA